MCSILMRSLYSESHWTLHQLSDLKKYQIVFKLCKSMVILLVYSLQKLTIPIHAIPRIQMQSADFIFFWIVFYLIMFLQTYDYGTNYLWFTTPNLETYDLIDLPGNMVSCFDAVYMQWNDSHFHLCFLIVHNIGCTACGWVPLFWERYQNKFK